MLDTSARLLRLLSLLQTPRAWPGSELAERLGVSGRTVRNDIDRLRELGYPVDATRGAAGGYRLGAGAAMPPLLLDDEEAVAVTIALRTAAQGAAPGTEETSLRALAKLEQVLPSRLRRRVRALQAYTVAVPADRPAPTGPRSAPREPPGGDLAAYVSLGVSGAAWRHHARVTVHAPAATVVERINPAVGTVEALDADSCVLITGADTLQTLAVHLGMLDLDFDVTEPVELVTHLRRLAERYARSTPPPHGGEEADGEETDGPLTGRRGSVEAVPRERAGR
ncbi:helix-turn-helix transcriptional regulator [Kitasatospora sp. NPDC050543]|uniref:helix-turn-helix transcriptional regulator n=1 Tax=Kitasatospora sp. NPDC050543 TaxID=3364054 RepID=UPI0037B47A74